MFNIGDGMSFLTDAAGLTDTKAAGRAASSYNSGINAADKQLHSDLEPLYNTYLGEINNGRSLGEGLDKFDSRVNQANADIGATYNDTQDAANKAMTSSNIQGFMNPYAEYKANAAADAVAGNAGGSLQSSAATQGMYDAAAKSYANDWNSAANTAQNDYNNTLSANNQALSGIGQQTANYGNQLSADLTPFQQYQDLLTSEASQKYAGNVAATQAISEAEGENKSWLNQLLGSALGG